MQKTIIGLSIISILLLQADSSDLEKRVELLEKALKENSIKTILQDVYHEKKTARFIADRTGAKVNIVPHDVGAIDEANSLEDFYKIVGRRICR